MTFRGDEGGKKTWQDFKEIVGELRKQLSSLSTMAPSFISFRKYSDGRSRLFFVSSLMNGVESTLLYANIPKDDETKPNARLSWCPVIENIACTSKFSREEQLMLERKRLATWGITSYEFHEQSGRLVFPASSTLFHCTDNGFSVRYICLSFVRFILIILVTDHKYRTQMIDYSYLLADRMKLPYITCTVYISYIEPN